MTTESKKFVSGESDTRTKLVRREILIKERAKLVLAPELVAQILFNHQAIGATEWSGFLFYKETEGDITDPSSLELRAEGIYLQDIGTSAYTDFEMTGEKILEMVENYPDYEDCRKGLIHTHHSMSCFFSGTDKDELQENADNHVYYLSLIVNFLGPWCARIAVTATMDSIGTVTKKNSLGNTYKEEVTHSEEVLYLIDCDIAFELPEYYVKNYDDVKKSKAKKTTPYRGTNSGYQKDWPRLGEGDKYNSIGETLITFVNVKDVLIVAIVKSFIDAKYSIEEHDMLTYATKRSLYQAVEEADKKVSNLNSKLLDKFEENFDDLVIEVFEYQLGSKEVTSAQRYQHLANIYTHAISALETFYHSNKTFADKLKAVLKTANKQLLLIN